MKRKYLMCDLEYAVKLKELGVQQNSLFYIDEYGKIYNEKEAELIFGENEYYKDIREPIKLYSAFIAEELTEILPKLIETQGLRIDFEEEMNYIKFGSENSLLKNAQKR